MPSNPRAFFTEFVVAEKRAFSFSVTHPISVIVNGQ